MKIINHLFNIIVVFLLLAAVASSKSGKLMGVDNSQLIQARSTLDIQSIKLENETKDYPLPTDQALNRFGGNFKETSPSHWSNAQGIKIIYSAPYASNVIGYASNTPLYIFIKNDTVKEVVAAQNDETPAFFEHVKLSGLLDRWNNMPVSKIAQTHVDGVSGATFSSTAIIKTMQATAIGITGESTKTSYTDLFSPKMVIALLVLLSGLLISIFANKKKWRLFQLILNVGVLGFWCGQFISFIWLIDWISSGTNVLAIFVPFVMLLLALLVPMFRNKQYYCTWICPFGAAQELVSKIPTKKQVISPKVMKYLKHLREAILILIMVLAWLGIGFKLINYEPFSAFMFKEADTVVIAIALLFLALSLVVHRPWCRFVCPTGQILDWCESSKNKQKLQTLKKEIK